MKKSIALAVLSAYLGGLLVISATPASASPDKFALLIGVARFKGKTASLPGSDGDAHDMRTLLVNNGWSANNIRTLVNQQATVPAILEGLEWLAGRCTGGTECVFKYSGHVRLTNANDGDREATDENLWTHENGNISDGVLAGYLRRMQGRAWIDISGCEAAGFDDNVASSNRVFTGSSQEHEKSYESPAYKNSVWTELLVNQGLAQGKNLADAFNFASKRAAEETAGQRRGPQHAYMKGGDPSSWFNRTAAPPRASNRGCLLGLVCL